MARMILATPEGTQVVELRPHNTLGRHPSNSIQLLDKIVSKEHCVVEKRGDAFVLRDLGSLNGTYINGERVIGERGLRHGDDIALGATRARYDDGSGAPVPPPANAAAPAPAWQAGAQEAARAGAPAGQDPTRVPPVSPFQASALAARPLAAGAAPATPVATQVNVSDQLRAIGTQIAAQKGFLPVEQIANNPAQLAQDYERLRLSHELSREIALERDLPRLLNRILLTIFKSVRADRGVIFLRDAAGELTPSTSIRRDGSEAAINVSSTIMNHVIREKATVLTHDAAMDFAASKGKSMILNRIGSAVVAPMLHEQDIVGVVWLDSESLAVFQPKDLEIVTAIAAQAAMFIQINILGKKVEQEIVNRERFSRLLSPNVAQKVMSGELEVKKGGQLVHECTVFNSDIRGFTRMSDGASPELIVEMLNEYFERMVETLFKYDGTLDKFMGDGIMALWGAPQERPDDAERSVACALEQMEELAKFNRERADLGDSPLGVGIGIHTGPLVAGYIGSSKALSYTVIGDTANTSARLCGVAGSGQIIVSEETLRSIRDKFEWEELTPQNLKGKEKPVRVFNVLGTKLQLQVPVSVSRPTSIG